MTNRKLKRVQDNMKAARSFRETARNLLTFYLGMLNAGISKSKIKRFDSDLIANEVSKYRRDARDGVIDYKVDRFLESVNIPIKRLQDFVYSNNGKHLKEAFTDNQTYNVVVDCLVTDLAVYLLLVSNEYGYGNTRLCRILDFMEHYKGDPFENAYKEFGFQYGDESEIPDMSLYKRKKQRIDSDFADIKRNEMQAVKVIQGIS